MKKWQKVAVGLGAGVGAAGAYGEYMRRRNLALGLARPGARDAHGALLPQMQMEYSDGERVTLLDVGSGTPIVLVPGADGMKETFRYQYGPLARRLRVICADLRAGFAPDDTFNRFAQDLVELLDARGVGSAILLGQSLGSAIAANFAALLPRRVLALILANPLARVSYEHLGFNRTGLVPLAMTTTRYLPTAAARLVARLWSSSEVWIYDNSPGRANVIDYALWTGPRTVPPHVSRHRVDLLKALDLRPELPMIEAPTLVVKGPHDHYVPPEWAIEIAAAIPRARYEIVPGTGHCSHISMPGSFNRLVRDWIEETLTTGEATAGAEA